jgi:hypothetical protein
MIPGKLASKFTACAGLAALVLGLSGCVGVGGYDGAPAYTGPVGVGGSADCVSPMPSKNPQIIFEFVSGPHCNDQTYGDVDGYFFDQTFKHFEIIQITSSVSNTIVFQNVDGQDHMTSSLGPWTGSWPASGPSPSATPSPQGTDIGSAGWTTGIIAPGAESRAYIANVPGMYVVGDPFFYTSNNMRTILIVQ